MKVKVIAQKKYNRSIYISNHQSFIDDFIIFPTIPGHFRPLGKKEMVKIPLWGHLYKHVVVLVDRRSPESRALSMKLMADVLHNEGSVLIFPEGTFNETASPLKEFYDGAFRLAITSQSQVIPLIFPDAIDRAPYHTWWKMSPGRNRAIFLDPISTVGLTLDDVPKIKMQAYQQMESALLKYRTA